MAWEGLGGLAKVLNINHSTSHSSLEGQTGFDRVNSAAKFLLDNHKHRMTVSINYFT